ncbi:Predicted esterase [Actinomyces bovis]|uniref:Predicted esterase n=1 Tax=Actinomyces bovis TaxID=1658 RepID=A0ABY1VLI1_9ACTO|nr:alpha/beta hydrolase [Actinomyces bovis]SPT52673.1 Predicted esterase [Actinomyces bovis]VEG54591.1 Predicted esterase [Actinomyces israelii]
MPNDHEPDPQTHPLRRSPLLSAALLGATGFIALLALAMFLPIPALDYSLMLGTWGLAATILIAAMLLVSILALRKHPSHARRLAAALAAASLVATGVVASAQLRQAQQLGASINWWQASGIGQWGSLPDEEPTFMEDAASGQKLQAGVWLPHDPATGRKLSAQQVQVAHPDGVPVVVLLHGGGWHTGNRRNPMTKGQATWLAQQGYLAIALDYPLSLTNLPTWQLAESRSALGLAWVGREAANWGGDVKRLALVGDSSGGHLALELAARQVLGTMEEICPEPVPQIRALSLTYPVADPVGFHDNSDLIMAPYVSWRAAIYVGGSPTQQPERFAEISPINKVHELQRRGLGAQLPPVLMVHGERDHVVPVDGTQRLHQALIDAGARSQLVEIPYADHVFDLNPGSVPSQLWRHLTIELLNRSGMGT